jgi:SSS family transporter
MRLPSLAFVLGLVLASIASATETAPSARFLAVPGAPAPAAPDLLAPLGPRWLAIAGTHAWTRDTGAPAWDRLELPEGFAVPADSSGTAAGAAWILVGGANRTAVTRLTLADGKLRGEALPPLPDARAGAGVAVLDSRLFVVGGRDAAGSARAEVFALDLRQPEAWERVGEFPGGPVVRPAMGVQYGELTVAGGTSADGSPSSQVWSYRIKPLDGTTATGWFRRGDAPVALAGAVLVPSGTAHLLAFLPGRAEVHVFSAIVDAWYTAEGVALPPAGLVTAGSGPSARAFAADGSAEFRLEVDRPTYALGWLDYTTLTIYFALMVFVGVWLSGKHETSDQFALGNRDVKWWAAGISMFATGASSISFMAIPALAFATNLVWFLPTTMVIVGYFVSGYIIYPLVRKLEITSTYEYLDRRFNRALRLLASAQCIVFQTFGRMSVVMVLPSLAISALTGMEVMTSVLLMGVLTTVYTAIGGFNAVIWTDVAQGALMIVAPLLVIGYAVAGTDGGLAGSIDAAQSYEKLRLLVVSWDLSLPVFWILLLGSFFSFVAVVGDQPVVQRIYSVPLPQVRRTALMSAICGLTISVLTYGMGTAMFGFFRSQPELLAPSLTNDQVVPLFIVQNLPAGVCGVVIASIFAAAMSTLSSSMNSVATLICEDFYKPLFPQSSDRARVRLMKVASYAVGAIGTAVAVWMGQMETTSMFATWNRIIGLLGGGFVGIYMLGLFTTRTNSAGAIAGGLASIVVMLFIDRWGGLHWLAYMPVATTTCLVIGYVVSLVTGGSRKDLAGLTAFTTRAKPAPGA